MVQMDARAETINTVVREVAEHNFYYKRLPDNARDLLIPRMVDLVTRADEMINRRWNNSTLIEVIANLDIVPEGYPYGMITALNRDLEKLYHHHPTREHPVYTMLGQCFGMLARGTTSFATYKKSATPPRQR